MMELPKTWGSGGRRTAKRDGRLFKREGTLKPAQSWFRARAHCLLSLAVALGFAKTAHAAGPIDFYLVERFLTLGILVHFDVDPLRTYELQSTTNFAAASGQAAAPTNAWRTVYRVDATPFANHYIIPEFFTNTVSQQFYRLVATP